MAEERCRSAAFSRSARVTGPSSSSTFPGTRIFATLCSVEAQYLGSVVLGLSVGSSDYCLDKTPSRKLEEKLMAVTERTVKGSLVEKSAQKVLGASGSVRL